MITSGVADLTRLPLLATLALLSGLVAIDARALNPDWQASQFNHQAYTREHGLPADIVWSVEQSRRGYLWLGTQNGLVRFDGVHFDVFDRRRDPAFLSNDIRVVTEAPDGSIWAGTYGGGALHRVDGRFVALTQADGLADDIVYDIFIASDDTVWFGTAAGVTRLTDGGLQSWTTADGLAADRVYRIAEDQDGTIWLATLTGGLSRFDGQSFTRYTESDGLDSVQIHLLFKDRSGMIAGSYLGGLFHLTGGDRIETVPRGGLPADLPMQSALRDGDDNLWIGSYGRGLWRWNIDGPAEDFDLGARNPTHIFDLLEDREGNLWAASMNGLHRLAGGLFTAWGAPEGLADTTFVVAEHNGDIWTGSEGRGLFRLTPEGRVTRISTADGLSSNSVSALLFDSSDRIWAGTFGGGVNRIEDGRIQHIRAVDGLTSDHIFAIFEHSGGDIWIAAEGGLNRLVEGRIESLADRPGLPNGLIRHIMEDDAGHLWFSTSNGLCRWDGLHFRIWGEADGLAGPVSTSWQDERGSIWIGMRNGGLARLNGEDLFRFGADHGLPQESVLAILADDSGNLWLSGSAGLVKANRRELDAVADGRAKRTEARLYNESDGLRSSQFLGGFQPAAARARDGRLWFPTNRGLAVIDPAQSEQESSIGLEVVIEQVRINSSPTDPDQLMTLPATARSLEIDYTAPHMSAPERVRFRYRLKGLNEQWQDAGDRRTAYFTGLPPGPMEFEVQATTLESGFGSAAAPASNNLPLYRQPYFYQTWWFTALLLVAAGLAVFGIYRLALGRVRTRQQRLEHLVHKRTRELRQALIKVERLSRIDGLTGVANRRYFEEMLSRLWADAVAQQMSISVILLDIDRFKQYNDSAGHQAGDECLRRVAGALQSGVMRDDDLVARYGGEEFVILLPNAGSEVVSGIAERIRRRIEELEIPHPDSDVKACVTVSLGAATAPTGQHDSPEALIERADRALYRAKHAGRNRVATS